MKPLQNNRQHRGLAKSLRYLFLIALLLPVGCAKAPHEELQAAEKILRDAESVGAPIYLPEEFTALVTKLETAKEEIETQYKESEFSRNYSRAHSLLSETREKGDHIIAEAQKRREQAKAAALQEKEQAKEAIHGVRQLVERVEQSKPGPVEKIPDELAAEADELNRRLKEVQTAIEANNHVVAKDKARAIQVESQKLKTEVQSKAAP